jgi:hypothetical protein
METKPVQTNNEIENRAKDNQAQEDRGKDLSYPQWMPRGLFKAIGPISLVVLVVGAAVGFYAYHYVTKDSVRFSFWVSFMFSLLAFVVLLVQSVIYAQQAEFMREQSNAMRDSVDRTDTIIENMQGQLEALKDEAEAAKISAKAAERALDENREAANTAERINIYAQRAYVVAKIRGKSKEPDRLQFRLRIVNTGNTPANEVWVYYSHGLLTEPPHKESAQKWIGTDKNIVVYDLGYEQSERIGLIAPVSSYHVIETGKKGPLTSEEAQQWKLGKLKYYCWGRITYDTIFEDDRYSEFCFYQSFEKPDGYPCKHGNEAI